MVGIMDHDGLETVASSMSQGNEPQLSECSDIIPQETRCGRHQDAMEIGAEAETENEARNVKKKGPARRRRAPYHTPARDFKGRFLPKRGAEGYIGGGYSDAEHIHSLLRNPRAPDFTTVISILHGKKSIRQCRRIKKLKNPDFIPLMNAMSNSEQEAVDEGPYDVLKVLMQADCSPEC